MTPLTITTPYPAGALWPNTRPHWTLRARLVKTQRFAAALATRSAIAARPTNDPWQTLDSATLSISLHCPAQAPDPDNAIAALKSTIDGLVDGGALTNDRHLRLILEAVLPKSIWSRQFRPTRQHKMTSPPRLLLPYLSAVYLTLSPE